MKVKKCRKRLCIILCAAMLFSSAMPVRVFAEESEIQEQAADQEKETGNEEEKKETDKAASEEKNEPEKSVETETGTEKPKQEEPYSPSGDAEKEGDGTDEKELIEDGAAGTKESVETEGEGNPADSGTPEEEAPQDGTPEGEEMEEPEIPEIPEEESILVTFYTMDEEEEYYELAEREADAEGHVEFPDVPYIEGYAFDCWQTEDFENVDEDKAFTESCDLYAVFDLQETEPEDIPAMHAAARASNIGISAANPQSGQQNRYEYSGSAVAWTVPATGYYDISCYGA
ncbi:MAG: hypothetical protein J6C33_08880, partial [Lachnospiraceae bacterium]|nr:hypothetical protein [Lachnospiraceae bacterium]